MASIRTRFLLVSAISVALALVMASLVLIALFGRNLEARIDSELSGHVQNIAGALRIAADGSLDLPGRPVDRRFEEPYGGLYWQVEDDQRGSVLRSPSLWDYVLPLPKDAQPSETTDRYTLPGPEGTGLIVQEREILVGASGGERTIRIAVAINASEVEEASRAFAADIIPYMIALAVFLVAASLAQLLIGLRPIASVSRGLNRIRERKAERLDGEFPSELNGVVDAVNRLLDAQGQLIDRAKSRAADLAHGLKTPLTVLANDAATLRQRGETEIAEEIAHLARVMQAHVEHELTRSRIAVSPDLRRSDADLADCVEKIVRTLKRTPRGESLSWSIEVAAGVRIEMDPNDLQELLGNILDNAVKWGRTAIRVTSGTREARPLLTIEDDGPGADPDGLPTLMERGKRLDLQTPGTGIGLAVVRDIAEVYGLAVKIENRHPAGLKVTIGF